MNLRQSVRVLTHAAIAAALAMGAVVVVARLSGVSTSTLTRDAAAVMGAQFYVGAVTTLRVMLLIGAGAVCLFTSLVLRKSFRAPHEFLGALGVFTVVLALDDQFQIHEDVLDRSLGVPQPVTYAVYAVVILFGAARYGRLVLSLPEGGLLVSVFMLFGAAVVVDTIEVGTYTRDLEAFLEIFAIACLAYFELRISWSMLRAATTGTASVGGGAMECASPPGQGGQPSRTAGAPMTVRST